MNQPDTNALIILTERCRRGDRKAQEFVFQHYYDEFMKICLRYSPDKQSADALLSEAFFRIFTRISSFTGSGSFEGWMRKIVVNTCLLQLRQDKHYNSRTRSMPEPESLVGDSTAVGNEAWSSLGLRELIAQIQSLPKMSRTVFNLNVFEGYTHKEIAEALSISEGTSHWHLSYARQLLKAKLKVS